MACKGAFRKLRGSQSVAPTQHLFTLISKLQRYRRGRTYPARAIYEEGAGRERVLLSEVYLAPRLTNSSDTKVTNRPLVS